MLFFCSALLLIDFPPLLQHAPHAPPVDFFAFVCLFVVSLLFVC